LPNLRKLDLRNNSLTDLPKDFDLLESVCVLKLDFNLFDCLPDVVCDIPLLEDLSISNNQLISLPKNIENLGHLQQLNISENKIKKIPIEIGKLF